MHWDWFRRQEAATEAEPQGLRDEFGEGGRPGAR
jgi:hypothetical protein